MCVGKAHVSSALFEAALKGCETIGPFEHWMLGISEEWVSLTCFMICRELRAFLHFSSFVGKPKPKNAIIRIWIV